MGRALRRDRDALKVLMDAVREESPEAVDETFAPSDEQPERALLNAVRSDRSAVLRAITRQKKYLVKILRSNTELVDVLLSDLVPVADVTSVELQTSANGHPQLLLRVTGGGFHEVEYEVDRQEEFNELAEALRTAVARKPDAPPELPSRTLSLDDLERLADLRDRGLITETDYETAKQRILGT